MFCFLSTYSSKHIPRGTIPRLAVSLSEYQMCVFIGNSWVVIVECIGAHAIDWPLQWYNNSWIAALATQRHTLSLSRYAELVRAVSELTTVLCHCTTEWWCHLMYETGNLSPTPEGNWYMSELGTDVEYSGSQSLVSDAIHPNTLYENTTGSYNIIHIL